MIDRKSFNRNNVRVFPPQILIITGNLPKRFVLFQENFKKFWHPRRASDSNMENVVPLVHAPPSWPLIGPAVGGSPRGGGGQKTDKTFGKL